MIADFSIARIPRILFGHGALTELPRLARTYGTRVLLVTGARSFLDSERFGQFDRDMKANGMQIQGFTVEGEPSPVMIDDAVRQYHDAGIDVVIGLGGGSALDAAKAIAGLLRVGESVMDYLEGVGPELPYRGPCVPLLAVPTTAGTGSEATKNAVLSKQGQDGFKKSFRDEQLVPEHAIIDPDLLESCPPALIAANGMDALTQLMESYVSLRANAITDALALSGIEAVRDGLLPWYRNAVNNPGSTAGKPADSAEARAGMAYGALLSGITLAQTGLGSVHGLASPLGAFFPIPHGVVCGTLVGAATAMNLRAMAAREPDNPALEKYAHVGRLLCQEDFATTEAAWNALVDLLHNWTAEMDISRLSAYGISKAGFSHIVANSRGSSMKTNPIVLTDEEITGILSERL